MEISEFGLRLAKLRTQKGVSARNMSLSIGQCEGYINSIETGKAKPSYDGIMFICEYLGVTPSEFFDTQSVNPSKLNALIKDMKKLNDQQLDMISLLVRDIVKNK